MNGAPRRWRNRLDQALRQEGWLPVRADRCLYVKYAKEGASGKGRWSRQTSRKRAKGEGMQPSGTSDVTDMSDNSGLERAIEYLLDPVTGSPSRGRRVVAALIIHVDDLLMGGEKPAIDQAVRESGAHFAIGSVDYQDIMFTGQRIARQ